MKGRSAPSLSPCLRPSLCMHPTRKPSLIPRGRDRPTDRRGLSPSLFHSHSRRRRCHRSICCGLKAVIPGIGSLLTPHSLTDGRTHWAEVTRHFRPRCGRTRRHAHYLSSINHVGVTHLSLYTHMHYTHTHSHSMVVGSPGHSRPALDGDRESGLLSLWLGPLLGSLLVWLLWRLLPSATDARQN